MISENLKSLRLERGLTQQKLASIFKTSRQNISHLESGYIEPNCDMLRKYCVFFDISADEILDLNTEKDRKSYLEKINFDNLPTKK